MSVGVDLHRLAVDARDIERRPVGRWFIIRRVTLLKQLIL
jgi:hypothetical protein